MSRRSTCVALASVAAFAAPALANSLYFDFGDPGQTTPGNYNNMWHNGDYPDPPSPILDAVDDTGLGTGISLTCTDIFWPGTNYSGTTTPAGDALQFEADATRDNFFGSAVDFGGFTEPTGGFTLEGLDPGLAYQFTFFASRMGVSDNREAYYTVSGGGSDTVYLDSANNTSEVAMTGMIFPDANGAMTIEVGPGPNNTNGSKFYYIGSMRIDVVPEPAAAWLLISGLLLVRRR